MEKKIDFKNIKVEKIGKFSHFKKIYTFKIKKKFQNKYDSCFFCESKTNYLYWLIIFDSCWDKCKIKTCNECLKIHHKYLITDHSYTRNNKKDK